jgi:WS/DGAT/MGAT family acyltransferase
MMDGVSGLRLLQRTLSESPDESNLAAPYLPAGSSRRSSGGGGGFSIGSLSGLLGGVASEAMSLGPSLFRLGELALREQAATLPMQAPRTIFNGGITGARRFAAQSWSLETMKAVAKAADVSLNDVLLAMCGGALRRYLEDLDALPDNSLTAMIPVSLRQADDAGDGNAVGAIIASLGTDVVDPGKRLAGVHESMQAGKELLSGMSRTQVLAMSAMTVAPLAMSSLFGMNRFLRPPFNLVISNVPGPRRPLWWSGAALDAVYPLSIPTVGQALNITVTSYTEHMEFGLTGCRRSAPHLQRLLTHLDSSLEELVRASGA